MVLVRTVILLSKVFVQILKVKQMIVNALHYSSGVQLRSKFFVLITAAQAF